MASSAQTPPFNISPYEHDSDQFDSEPDPNSISGKRITDREDIHGVTSKRTRLHSSSSTPGDCRKDREEWSDTAITCLLEAYTEKFVQLNRGNLRCRDWEEVAAVVSERCEKQTKTVEQCKNKVDNLKKRYKLERHRLSNGGVSVSHWPWSKQMEQIVGNSVAAKAAAEEEKFPGSNGTGKELGTLSTSPGGQVMSVKPKSLSLRWRRFVFKVSGAALAGTAPNNMDPKNAVLHRFLSSKSTSLTTWKVAMLIAREVSVASRVGVETRVHSAFSMPEVAEPYGRQRAIRHLEKGRVVIFGGIGAGTGNPLFSTDTAASLRASEKIILPRFSPVHADAVLKGTNVDGIYICDSRNENTAAEHISFRDLASRGASPMDMMAMTFCEENIIPVVVFNLHKPGKISRALCGEQLHVVIELLVL
ncbi:uncharacterized protein [Primulina huaijiensis]|uniref:uncharacterized protein n=1 Tax=Primulina huaijiensis TaxID=1492673 RepID=UPI003CC77D6D